MRPASCRMKKGAKSAHALEKDDKMPKKVSKWEKRPAKENGPP